MDSEKCTSTNEAVELFKQLPDEQQRIILDLLKSLSSEKR